MLLGDSNKTNVKLIIFIICGWIKNEYRLAYVILGYRGEVAENCAPLGHYTASSGKFLQMFRDNLSVQSPRFLNFFTDN